MNNKAMVDKWVINTIVILLVGAFVTIIGTMLALAWNQIVYHSSETTSYASEFVGILNSILLIGVGVFFSSLIGKIFGIKPEDIQKSIDQSVKASKEIGLEKTVQLHIDKLQASPNTDDENN